VALASATGTAFAVSFYVLGMVVLTLVALWAAPETAWEDCTIRRGTEHTDDGDDPLLRLRGPLPAGSAVLPAHRKRYTRHPWVPRTESSHGP